MASRSSDFCIIENLKEYFKQAVHTKGLRNTFELDEKNKTIKTKEDI